MVHSLRTPKSAVARVRSVALIGGLLTAAVAIAAQGAPSPQERVAALKQSMTESQKRLRQYEWIETTVISLKGEEKSRKQQRCYYGADGKVQKVPLDTGQPPQQAAGGRRRRGGPVKQAAIENKKEGMQDYMEQAASLVHQYVPPNPDLIEKAKTAGTISVRPGQAGHVGVDIADYLKPGDKLSLDIDGAARSLGVNVASYLDTPEDAITLAVQFGALGDGTSYANQSTLDAKAKNVRLVIQNTGYRPISR